MLDRWGKQTGLWAQVGFYASLGFIIPSGAVAGYALGWALDRWLHTEPWLAVTLAFLGAGGGFVEILRLLVRAEKSGSTNNRTE